MTIAREGRFSHTADELDRDDNAARNSVGGTDPHAEKSTKALIGIVLLVTIGFAMYGLGAKQPGANAPTAQIMARSIQQH